MTARADGRSLRALLAEAIRRDDAGLDASGGLTSYRRILESASLAAAREMLAGRSVLLGMRSQLASALAMLELDGVASRLVIVPADFSAQLLASVIEQAEVDVIICDDARDFGVERPRVPLTPHASPAAATDGAAIETEWVLPTSGTTGAPKLVAHTLDGLLGAIRPPSGDPPVWSTFYDIRRYGGLQIFLRAVTGGATLVMTEADEPLAAHVARMVGAGVTHLTGTPSHWRRLLMSPEAISISPRYVRLSGEIADRAILESLKVAFPDSHVIHAYASTEAGVGFEVTDGREGFPASYLDGVGDVEMRVVDDTLRIRSRRTARRYVGRDLTLVDENGFVDTDDLVERKGDRYYFRGRRAGTINIGGLKVSPEEVEQVINQHEAVRMSLVKARRNPITGALIVADVVLKDPSVDPMLEQALREEILDICRTRLDRHKTPTAITFVPALDMNPSGKLQRRYA